MTDSPTRLSYYIRLTAGLAVLVVLAFFAALMLPPCVRNLEFQRFLEQAVADPKLIQQPPDVIRVAVASKAAQLGLPVGPGHVRLTRLGNRFEIEVRYIVRIDLPLYTVDLHFRPLAGAK